MIKLICFIESMNHNLLKHFITHYNKIGVETYHFICLENNNLMYFQDNVYYHTISLKQFVDEQKKQGHKRRSCHFVFENMIKEQYISNHDYCLIVDLDEFIDITNHEIMSIINSEYNVAEGYLVDRISHNGKISELVVDIDISEQFPRKVRLTKYSNRCEKKIFLTKGCIKHQCGHHCLINYTNTKFYPHKYQIFHYKWFQQNLTHLTKTYPFDNYFANNELKYLHNNQFLESSLQDIESKYPVK